MSNLYSPNDHLSTFCGSLYFAAPELLNARAYIGPEVDIWSFGIVLYVLVCGKVPFDDQSMPALHAKIKRGMVDYPAWLSSECKDLLSRMLVTDPNNRATLAEVLASPWLNKGYETPTDSYLVPREPLRPEELDNQVIRGMAGFEFGSEEAIRQRMVDILSSDQYRRATSSWEDRKRTPRKPLTMNEPPSPSRASPSKPSGMFGSKDGPSKRFSGLRLFKSNSSTPASQVNGKESPRSDRTSMLESEAIDDQGMLDPTRGFHPLLSIYYLVREKNERDRVYGPGQFASSDLTIAAQSRNGMSNELDPKSAGRAPGYAMALPRLPAPETSHAPPRGFDSAGATPSSSVPGGPSDPAVSARSRGESLNRRPDRTADLRDAGIMQHPEEDFERSHLDQIDAINARSNSAHRRSYSMTGKSGKMADKGPSNRIVSSASQNVANRSVKEEDNLSRQLQDTVISSESATPRVGAALPTNQPTNQAMPPASFGSSGSAGMNSASTEREARPPRDDGVNDKIDAKPVYLKGLFSVATTTSKSVATLQTEIKTVLDRIGLRYRPIKTGFECIHVPSINLSSVQPTNGLGPPAQNHISSGVNDEDFDAWTFSENGGAGSALLVRFEISIVKVSVLFVCYDYIGPRTDEPLYVHCV